MTKRSAIAAIGTVAVLAAPASAPAASLKSCGKITARGVFGNLQKLSVKAGGGESCSAAKAFVKKYNGDGPPKGWTRTDSSRGATWRKGSKVIVASAG